MTGHFGSPKKPNMAFGEEEEEERRQQQQQQLKMQFPSLFRETCKGHDQIRLK